MPRPPDIDTPLGRAMRGYAGGLAGLAEAAGLAVPTVERIAAADHRTCPEAALASIAQALGLRPRTLILRWHAARRARLASLLDEAIAAEEQARGRRGDG